MGQLSRICQCSVESQADETTPLVQNYTCREAEWGPEDVRPSKIYMVSGLLPAFSRPLKLLLFSPVCAASSVIISSTAGTTNLIFASLGRTFQEQYGFSTSASGLVYLAVTVGFVVAAFLFGTTNEYTSQLLVNRNHGKREPEYRLPGAFLGPLLIAVGLCWYGWTAQDYIFWAFPVLGLNVVGMGITLVQVNFSVSKRKYLEYANTRVAFSADICGGCLR